MANLTVCEPKRDSNYTVHNMRVSGKNIITFESNEYIISHAINYQTCNDACTLIGTTIDKDSLKYIFKLDMYKLKIIGLQAKGNEIDYLKLSKK